MDRYHWFEYFRNPYKWGTETPIFTPTNAEIANGFVNLTVTAQPLTGCSATATQIIKVNLRPKATANAGSDIVVCQGNSIVLNNGANTTATFSIGQKMERVQ